MRAETCSWDPSATAGRPLVTVSKNPWPFWWQLTVLMMAALYQSMGMWWKASQTSTNLSSSPHENLSTLRLKIEIISLLKHFRYLKTDFEISFNKKSCNYFAEIDFHGYWYSLEGAKWFGKAEVTSLDGPFVSHSVELIPEHVGGQLSVNCAPMCH
jgi:hypothetical protein